MVYDEKRFLFLFLLLFLECVHKEEAKSVVQRVYSLLKSYQWVYVQLYISWYYEQIKQTKLGLG